MGFFYRGYFISVGLDVDIENEVVMFLEYVMRFWGRGVKLGCSFCLLSWFNLVFILIDMEYENKLDSENE